MLIEELVNFLLALLVFDKSWDVPMLDIMLNHLFKVFICRRFPIFEDRLAPIKLVFFTCLSSQLFDNMRDTLTTHRCHDIVEEVLWGELIIDDECFQCNRRSLKSLFSIFGNHTYVFV